jgi:hypothetical protein
VWFPHDPQDRRIQELIRDYVVTISARSQDPSPTSGHDVFFKGEDAVRQVRWWSVFQLQRRGGPFAKSRGSDSRRER